MNLAHTLLAALLFAGTALHPAAAETTAPVRIIFDTDMGSDCDDAGAMAVLHALAHSGEVEILGVIFSSGKNPYGIGVCDAINTWYGRGDLPLGQYHKDDVGDSNDSFSKKVATNTSTFKHDTVATAPEMISVYKTLLRSSPDASVTIVTVGHPHALSYLIDDSEALDLVRRKVKQCVSMGGAPDDPGEEWNLSRNGVRHYMPNILRFWPTPHYLSPAGEKVITGNRRLPSAAPKNPVRESYRWWGEGKTLETGRPSWDQLAVMYAARPHLFDVERGNLELLPGTKIQWKDQPTTPPRYRVTPRISNEELAALVEDLMTLPPK